MRDPSLDSIKVVIDVENTLIKIWNNGVGVPVLKNPANDKYYLVMFFSEPGTSYKFEGGKAGYGAKLPNIFSTSFIIKTTDGKKRYRQVRT